MSKSRIALARFIRKLAYVCWVIVLLFVLCGGAITFAAICALATSGIHPMIGVTLAAVILAAAFCMEVAI